MPLTFAHPAIALPLMRRFGHVAAWSIGCMSPDFPYFLWVVAHPRHAHRPEGVLLFCVPVGLTLLWFFHAVLKKPWCTLLPRAHCHALSPISQTGVPRTVRYWLTAAVVIALGACSHIGWDACTHLRGVVVQTFPELQALVPMPSWLPFKLYVYGALQHASTVVGLGVLVLAYRHWFHTHFTTEKAKPAVVIDSHGARLGDASSAWVLRVLLVVLSLVLSLVLYKMVMHPVVTPLRTEVRVGIAVISAIDSVLLVLLAFAFAWHAQQALKARQAK